MTDVQSLEKRTVSKVFRRLIPFLGLLYIIAFLDRVNVGFAALTMNQELGFSSMVYGAGAGMFFIGYLFLAVPGSLLLAKKGAKVLIVSILVVWGFVSAGTAFVSTPVQFYVVRFILGAAESAFFPGLIFYLSIWCREKDQAKAVAMFMMAMPLCNMFGAPISTYILGTTWLGLSGWKWLFLLEGIPALIFAILTPFYLTDRPAQAKWLNDDERNWLMNALEDESAKKVERKKYTLMQAFADRDVIILALIYFFWICGFYGLGMFLPILVKSLSTTLTNQFVGFLVMVPYLCAFIAMYIVGKSSDHTGERRWHTIFGMILGAVGLLGSLIFADKSVLISMVFFSLAVMGTYSSFGPFWAIPNSFLTASVAAGAIALINSIGNLGGFVGPYAMGWIREATGSFDGGIMFLVGCLALAAILLMLLRKSGKEIAAKNNMSA